MSDNYKRADGSKRICRCECGGWVRGVEDFGRLFTYCTKCTPVVKIKGTRAVTSTQEKSP